MFSSIILLFASAVGLKILFFTSYRAVKADEQVNNVRITRKLPVLEDVE